MYSCLHSSSHDLKRIYDPTNSTNHQFWPPIGSISIQKSFASVRTIEPISGTRSCVVYSQWEDFQKCPSLEESRESRISHENAILRLATSLFGQMSLVIIAMIILYVWPCALSHSLLYVCRPFSSSN